jgi:hypothetical protein
MNHCDFDKASNDFSSGKNKNFAKLTNGEKRYVSSIVDCSIFSKGGRKQ